MSIASAMGLFSLYVDQETEKVGRQDNKLLSRLNNMPVEEIESRAKIRELWHPKGNGISPAPGDLITFSLRKDVCSPHVGIVVESNRDGTVRVKSEEALRPGNPVNSTENLLDEGLTLKKGEVRGVISKPIDKSSISKYAKECGAFLPSCATLAMVEHLRDTMINLLQSGTKTSSRAK